HALVAGPDEDTGLAEGSLDVHAALAREHDVARALLGSLGREDGEAELHQASAKRPAQGEHVRLRRPGIYAVQRAERAFEDVHLENRWVAGLEAGAVPPQAVFRPASPVVLVLRGVPADPGRGQLGPSPAVHVEDAGPVRRQEPFVAARDDHVALRAVDW